MCGTLHSVFIDGKGRLLTCGSDTPACPGTSLGLLGHGEGVELVTKPTLLPSLLGERAVSVLAGAYHSLALAADGAVWSWGDGNRGRLGHGDEQAQWQPKKIEALAGHRVVAVSAGESHNLAIAADGAIWSWGAGYSG